MTADAVAADQAPEHRARSCHRHRLPVALTRGLTREPPEMTAITQAE